jgi:uncharacterized glyoxalase superfamily protein PhnB
MVGTTPTGDAAMADQTIFPYLYVQDVRSYLDFLRRAFGFEQRLLHQKDVDHVHAEATLGDTVVMIGCASPRWGTSTPRQLGSRHAALYVLVDDVDAHCRRARSAGARILEEPTDQEYGHRRYTVRDPEDQEWYFASLLG